MKILYFASTTDKFFPRRSSNHASIDYLSDCLLHGLKSKHSSDIVDIPYKPCMYKSSDVDKMDLYGRGFTISKTINDDETDRTDIEEKIKSKFFDCVIYGSIHRNRDYFDLVSSVYDKDKIAIIDGEDASIIDRSFVNKGLYFKRELLDSSDSFLPISFSFPKEKIQKQNKQKMGRVSQTMPSAGQDTFIWNNENDYYLDYNNSFFANTWKKGGWDCLRHYEIIFSYCYPDFRDVEKCPLKCLTTLPKSRIHNTVTKLKENWDENYYYDEMDWLFDYAKENMTTESMASYVLNFLL